MTHGFDNTAGDILLILEDFGAARGVLAKLAVILFSVRVKLFQDKLNELGVKGVVGI